MKRKALQPLLLFTCSVFMLESKVHMITPADGSRGLSGSCSSAKPVGCSVARPLLPYIHSPFSGLPQPCEGAPCEGEEAGQPH